MINNWIDDIYVKFFGRLILSILSIIVYPLICAVVILGWGISGLVNSKTNLITILKFIWEN